MDDGRSDGLECICRLGMVDNNGDWGAMNDDAIWHRNISSSSDDGKIMIGIASSNTVFDKAVLEIDFVDVFMWNKNRAST